jgi:hypothetical protein
VVSEAMCSPLPVLTGRGLGGGASINGEKRKRPLTRIAARSDLSRKNGER